MAATTKLPGRKARLLLIITSQHVLSLPRSYLSILPALHSTAIPFGNHFLPQGRHSSFLVLLTSLQPFILQDAWAFCLCLNHTTGAEYPSRCQRPHPAIWAIGVCFLPTTTATRSSAQRLCCCRHSRAFAGRPFCCSMYRNAVVYSNSEFPLLIVLPLLGFVYISSRNVSQVSCL